MRVGDTDRVPLGSVTFRSCNDHLGKMLVVTHAGVESVSQLYQKQGAARGQTATWLTTGGFYADHPSLDPLRSS